MGEHISSGGRGRHDGYAAAMGSQQPQDIALDAVIDGDDVMAWRFLASKPGAGFPIGAADGEAVGALVVTGAHTPDEEVG